MWHDLQICNKQLKTAILGLIETQFELASMQKNAFVKIAVFTVSYYGI